VSTRDPDVRVVAHLARKELSLSLDVAGEPLFRRGYRVRTTPAPLKETLAAAILRAAGYDGEEPLLDPMCGSGTFLTEAGWISRRRAPSLDRDFSIRRWPALGEHAGKVLDELRREARANEREAPAPILGMDRDPEALEAADANAAAAGLADAVQLAEGDATRPIHVPVDRPGLLVTNPPYGDRLTAGGQKGMKTFYFKLGQTLPRLAGWRMFVLAGNEAFESAFGQHPRQRRVLWNGPIRCELLGYENPA